MIDTIKKFGIDKTAELLSEYLNQKIRSEDVAIQFVLEELEAASQGNDSARQFALSSGFDEDDYKGAMYNSFEDVDGPDGPQQEILNLCMMLYPNQELMAELRIKTVDHIMKIWELGKYAAINKDLKLIDVVKKINDLDEGVFANINNDFNSSINGNEDIMILMAYGYARRVAAACLFLKGVFNKEHYNQAKTIFQSLQLQTGQSVEFQENAYSQAIDFLTSYDSRIDKEFVSKVVGAVELNQVVSAYEHGNYFSDEQIFQLFSEPNSNDSNWQDDLIQWAQDNNLPKREMITDYWGNPEYTGFPDTYEFIDEFVKRDRPFIENGSNMNTGIFNENLINLNNCNINDIPEEFYNLKGIYVLYLDSNNLSELSEKIHKLEYLDTVDLGNNNLQYLPDNFVHLKYLTYIRLSNNDLRQLPQDIIFMQNLCKIHLGNNPNLILTQEQKEWLLSLDPDEVSYDDDLLDRSSEKLTNSAVYYEEELFNMSDEELEAAFQAAKSELDDSNEKIPF